MKIKLLFPLMILLLVIPFSHSIGIGLEVEEIEFEPNLIRSLRGIISNNVGKDIRIDLRKKGNLTESVSFPQKQFNIPIDESIVFTFILKLPPKIKPGTTILYIGAEDITQLPPGGPKIQAKTAIFMPIKIISPYPGKYIEATFNADDISENKAVKFTIDLISKGTDTINRIDGTIEIFAKKGKITIPLDTITNIQPGEKRTIKAKWESNGYPVGLYKAKANINYDLKKLTLDTEFKIGTLLVKIINYTKDFYKDEINQFDIEIENFWNINIKDVYGEIEVGKEKIETLRVNLAPWSKGKITAYLDAHSLDLGEHKAKMNVYYAGKVEKVVGKISILSRVELPAPPSKIPSTTLLLVGVIALLIIGNVLLVLFLLKRRHKPEKKKK